MPCRDSVGSSEPESHKSVIWVQADPKNEKLGNAAAQKNHKSQQYPFLSHIRVNVSRVLESGQICHIPKVVSCRNYSRDIE